MKKRFISAAMVVIFLIALVVSASAATVTSHMSADYSEYEYIREFGEGMFLLTPKGSDTRFLADSNGNIITECEYVNNMSYHFQDGIAVVGKPASVNKLGRVNEYGVIDKTGKFIVEFGKYREINEYRDGFALVKDDNGNYTIIDRAGVEVFPMGHYINIDSAPYADLGTFIVQNESGSGVVDRAGNVVIPFEERGISYKSCGMYVFSYSRGSAWDGYRTHILADQYGSEVLDLGIDYISDFRGGFAICYSGAQDVGGIINTAGQILIPPGTYNVQTDGNRYYPSKIYFAGNGEAYMNGIFKVSVYNLTEQTEWLIDQTGREIVPFGKYNSIGDFVNGLSVVRVYWGTDSKRNDVYTYGVIDYTGKEIIPPGTINGNTVEGKYANSSYLIGNNVIIAENFDNGADYALLDRAGNVIIPFGTYKRIGGISRDSKWGNYERSGLIEVKDSSNVNMLVDLNGNVVFEGIGSDSRLPAMSDIRIGFLEKDKKVYTFTASATAQPSTQSMTIDGVIVESDRYNIDGSNYFKLRDLAKLLDGTDAQFEVGYSNGVVDIRTGRAYTANGTELGAKGTVNQNAVISNDKVTVNGKEAILTVYKINGSNYFKLRDLGDAIGFAVGYDAATSTMTVSTK